MRHWPGGSAARRVPGGGRPLASRMPSRHTKAGRPAGGCRGGRPHGTPQRAIPPIWRSGRQGGPPVVCLPNRSFCGQRNAHAPDIAAWADPPLCAPARSVPGPPCRCLRLRIRAPGVPHHPLTGLAFGRAGVRQGRGYWLIRQTRRPARAGSRWRMAGLPGRDGGAGQAATCVATVSPPGRSVRRTPGA